MRGRSGWTRVAILALAVAMMAAVSAPAGATRIGDLTRRPGDVPRRIVGYGLVVGLDGTGDRAYGGSRTGTPTVHSIVNLLRRFNVEVPADHLRPRNAAAVLVTAEVSPYLRAGGRFEVQVSAIGDATSLRGGVLWMTPLVADPGQPPVATAQGPMQVSAEERGTSSYARRANAARVPQGGLIEVDPPSVGDPAPRLLLRQPDLGTAQRIADAVVAAFGAGAAVVEDPGAVALVRPAASPSSSAFMAAVDTIEVRVTSAARIVINARDGTVVAGGDLRVGPALVSHRELTLQIGGASATERTAGLVRVAEQALVSDVAAGLHAAGARVDDMVAIFEALQASGALHAEIVIR